MSLKKTPVEVKVAVVLSDWCPACLEYKVTLNKVMSSTPIKIDFIPPSKVNVPVIPSTLFVKGKLIKRRDGFMTYEQFLDEYVEFREGG